MHPPTRRRSVDLCLCVLPAAGYNIIATLGVGMAKMTPSRGFCAELATSFVIVIASVYGLPVSSTQIIVGGEVGIGLCEVRLRRSRGGCAVCGGGPFRRPNTCPLT